MGMCMLISVVVPIYNVERYLLQSVDSILAQTYPHLEVILVDDGSSDRSCEICDKYGKSDPRVKVVHKSNGGLTSARRAGILAATGDYLIVVDGDDWIDAETVDRLVSVINDESDTEVVLFSYTKEYSDRSVPRHIFSKDVVFDGQEAVNQSVYRRFFGLTNNELAQPESLDYLSTLWGKLYRRDLALQGKYVHTQEVGSGEDGVFNMYALKGCKKVVYLDCPFYHYRKTAGSLTSRYRPNIIEEWKRLFAYMQEKIKADGLAADFQEALNNRIALSILGVGLNGLDNPDSGLIAKTKYVSNYIRCDFYRNAVSTMRLRKLPLVWKVLLFCCKYRMGLGVTVILQVIRLVKSLL